MDRPVNVIPSREARAHLGTMLSRFRAGETEPMYFGAHRKPEAAVIPFERYMQLLELEERWAAEDRLIEQVRARVAAADQRDQVDVEAPMTLEDLAAELGPVAARLLDEVKAEHAAEEIGSEREFVRSAIAKALRPAVEQERDRARSAHG